MAKKKSTRKRTAKKPAKKRAAITSFTALIKGRPPAVQKLAKRLKKLIQEELPGVEESFYTATNGMAMYRQDAEICWLQPLKERCNLYFLRGTELTDDEGLLTGSSDHHKFVRVNPDDDLEQLPIRAWLQETVALNKESLSSGISLDGAMERLRKICLPLPNTKETITWGKPHFRVGEKIFCGCGEHQGCAMIGLKADPVEADAMLDLPGITKSPYSRPNDGWITINPSIFDDWEEIEQLIIGSFRLIAPKRVAALLEE